MNVMRIAMSCLCVFALCLSGCQKQAGSSATPGTSKDGASGTVAGAATPEEMFARAGTAEKNQDWAALFDCYDPEKTDDLILGIVAGSMFLKEEQKKELQDVAKPHGLVWKDTKELMDVGKDKAKLQATMDDMLRNVRNKKALFVALFPVFVKAFEGRREFDGELTELKIEGDKAQGKVVKKQEEGKRPKPYSPLHFVKRDNRWYLTAEMK